MLPRTLDLYIGGRGRGADGSRTSACTLSGCSDDEDAIIIFAINLCWKLYAIIHVCLLTYNNSNNSTHTV